MKEFASGSCLGIAVLWYVQFLRTDDYESALIRFTAATLLIALSVALMKIGDKDD